ncbi:thymic stromal cotransporter homolog [Leucoraja erinacea]|uniref:thymic stromal cotransporter homolog n=1 Tax=Leucoraja erinaceus TaxID=7782 RepID=UPI00245386DF|nr:thymic stromal cotransporter homolog [Leucoraja erinacea]
MCGRLSSFVEIAVALHQVAGAFFDTTLLMVTQERCNSTAAGSQVKRQACVSRFYLYNNLLLGITPLVFTFILARLGDQKSRKITICVPLLGYLVSRSLLLWMILFQLPLEAMFATALLNGFSGGFASFWTGVMAFASDTSSVEERSARLIRIELTFGLAGMIGSVASGHIFVHFTLSRYQGAVLAASSCCLYALSLLYCTLVLKVPPKQTARTPLESDRLLAQAGQDHVAEAAAGVEAEQQNSAEDGSQSATVRLLAGTASAQDERSGCKPLSNITVVLLFAGGVLYDLSVAGGVDVIPMFMLKAPLKWNAVWVGYGNAAGYTIFLTSFLGVKVLSRYLKDTSLIVIGMVSFSSGMLIMAYVKWTSLFFIARAVMMFALIPLPMIRSVISKQISDTSYGKVLGLLQIFLTLTGVIASTIFLKIYMLTEDWYPSLCFSMSSVISCLSIIPIIIVERRLSEPSRYSRRLM